MNLLTFTKYVSSQVYLDIPICLAQVSNLNKSSISFWYEVNLTYCLYQTLEFEEPHTKSGLHRAVLFSQKAKQKKIPSTLLSIWYDSAAVFSSWKCKLNRCDHVANWKALLVCLLHGAVVVHASILWFFLHWWEK